MNLLFLHNGLSDLADTDSLVLESVKDVLLRTSSAQEVSSPDKADAIILQEKGSFKDFRYIKSILADPILSKYPNKVYTINSDDCATGLLRGLYTSLPKSRFNPAIHALTPYMFYPNELVFTNEKQNQNPEYLASWRGNPKSNRTRLDLIRLLGDTPQFKLEKTTSWLNHQIEEKESYVDLILDARFSLCPAGWAPVSYRIYESMALGRCPVILADQFTPPKGPDWKKFALFFPQKDLKNLHSFLHQHEHLYQQLGNEALLAWNKFFSKQEIQNYYAQTLFTLISSAPISTRETEIKRWNSLSLYWSNNWTLPQRILNKAKHLTRQKAL